MIKNIRVNLSKYRVLLLQKISHVLLGKVSGNVPETIVNSIEESFFVPAIQKHVEEIITVAEPSIESYPFPSSFPAHFRRYKAFDKKNLYVLKNVCVSPFTGLAWINNNFFLVESLGSLIRIIGWGNTLHEPLLKKEHLEEEEYVVSCPDHPYYHWVFESLPAILIALETMPSAKVMVSKKCPAYGKDLLKLLFGEQGYIERVIVAEDVKVVPRLFSLQQEPDAGFVHPIAIQYLQQFRDQLQQQLNHTLTSSYIYISRRKAVKRKLANEEEVEQAMKGLGFTILYCEDLTFRQQVAVFAKATVIVALHGAGLSNMIWAKYKISVLEIFPQGYFNDCFARLAVTLGFDYNYTFAREHKGSSGKVATWELVNLIQCMIKVEAQSNVFQLKYDQQAVGFFPSSKVHRALERNP